MVFQKKTEGYPNPPISNLESGKDWFRMENDFNRFNNYLFNSEFNFEFFKSPVYKFKIFEKYMGFSEVKNFIRAFSNIFGIHTATFSISQFGINWFGKGVNNFVSCLDSAKIRYDECPENLDKHDSEVGVLFGRIRGIGSFLIKIYNYINDLEKPDLVTRDFEFHLTTEGIPFQTYEFSLLLQNFGFYMPPGKKMKFEINNYSSEKPIIYGSRFLKKNFGNEGILETPVEIIDKINFKFKNLNEPEIVINEPKFAIIKNPFYEKRDEIIGKMKNIRDSFKRFLSLEKLLCEFERDYKPNKNYKLKSFKIAETEASNQINKAHILIDY